MLHSDTKEAVDLKNRFGLSEWGGALGDLGLLLPLAFALSTVNGFPLGRMLLLWGLVYIVTGWYYRVPVSVQPLKAMAAIAIAGGLSPQMLSSTAFFYGVLMVALSLTGAISWLKRWFSRALISGVQLGIGLILARGAIQLVVRSGLLVRTEAGGPVLGLALTAAACGLLWVAFVRGRSSLVLLLLVAGGAAVGLLGASVDSSGPDSAALAFAPPSLSFLLPGLMLLMIPQLPLTLGNAVFAASDTSRNLWGERAERVSPARLGLSIGLGNMAIGLLGGFPMCHGAGGMAAHARFGGRTGGTTIIAGCILVACALIRPASALLGSIPVPVLAAALLFTSWRMMTLAWKLETRPELAEAVMVGALSFLTGNLAIALVTGLLWEGAVATSRRWAAVRRVGSTE
jgi:SulP family sulfate permease